MGSGRSEFSWPGIIHSRDLAKPLACGAQLRLVHKAPIFGALQGACGAMPHKFSWELDS